MSDHHSHEHHDHSSHEHIPQDKKILALSFAIITGFYDCRICWRLLV